MRAPPGGSVLVAEALGTFLFFFVGMGAVVLGSHTGDGAGGLLGVALANGLALVVLVSALGAVSGAHFNPADTLAVLITGRITPMRAGMYMVQLAAAVAAGLVLRAIFPQGSWEPIALGTPTVDESIGVAGVIAVEAVLTVVLLVAVFGTAIDHRAPRLGGLAIGLAVAADILMGGPLTGAAMIRRAGSGPQWHRAPSTTGTCGGSVRWPAPPWRHLSTGSPWRTEPNRRSLPPRPKAEEAPH